MSKEQNSRSSQPETEKEINERVERELIARSQEAKKLARSVKTLRSKEKRRVQRERDLEESRELIKPTPKISPAELLEHHKRVEEERSSDLRLREEKEALSVKPNDPEISLDDFLRMRGSSRKQIIRDSYSERAFVKGSPSDHNSLFARLNDVRNEREEIAFSVEDVSISSLPPIIEPGELRLESGEDIVTQFFSLKFGELISVSHRENQIEVNCSGNVKSARLTDRWFSDVLSNLSAMFLWGTNDQPMPNSKMTPDHHSMGPKGDFIYEMKWTAGVRSAENFIKEMKEKYDPGDKHTCRLILVNYKAGEIYSNYDFVHDEESVGLKCFSSLVRQWKTVADVINTIKQSTNTITLASASFGGSTYTLKKPEPYHDISYEEYRNLLRLKVNDGLSWENVMAIPDDEELSHENLKKEMTKLMADQSYGNVFRPMSGVGFKSKITSVPMISYLSSQEGLFGVDEEVHPLSWGDDGNMASELFNKFTITSTGRIKSRMMLLELIFRKVLSEKNDPTTSVKWNSRSPEEVYDEQTNIKKMVNMGEVEEIIGKMKVLRERLRNNEITYSKMRTEENFLTASLKTATGQQRLSTDKKIKERRKISVMSLGDSSRKEVWTSNYDLSQKDLLIDKATYDRKTEERKQQWLDPKARGENSRNLPLVEDKEIDDIISSSIGESFCPKTIHKMMEKEFGVNMKGMDSNYDSLFIMSSILEECNLESTIKAGADLFLKNIPNTRITALYRISGGQIVCFLILDALYHDCSPEWIDCILEDEDENGKKRKRYILTEVFTVSQLKAEIMIHSHERYRLHKCLLMEDCPDGDDGTIMLRDYCNLTKIILLSQRTQDATNLTNMRYIGMKLRNSNKNRGDMLETFKKFTLNCRSRLSLFVIRKSLDWIKMEQEGRTVEGWKITWPYRDWLTGKRLEEYHFILSSWFMGNLYGVPSGKGPQFLRPVMAKLLVLEYECLDSETNKTINKAAEIGVFDWSKRYTSRSELIAHVCEEEYKEMIREDPSFIDSFLQEYSRIAQKTSSASYATGSSSFKVVSTSLADGYKMKSKESGKVTETTVRNPNYRRPMVQAVAEKFEKFRGFPLMNLTDKHANAFCDLICKGQRASYREVLVQTEEMRLSTSVLEAMCKSFCTLRGNEYLTSGVLKETKIIGYESRMNYIEQKLNTVLTENHSKFVLHRVSNRSSSDASKWCQLFRMHMFMIMIYSWFRTMPNLRDHLIGVLRLHIEKQINIPTCIIQAIEKDVVFSEEELNRLAREWGKDTPVHERGSCFVKIRANMLQGILHYCSSLFHSIMQNYFSRRVEEELTKILDLKISEWFSNPDLVLNYLSAKRLWPKTKETMVKIGRETGLSKEMILDDIRDEKRKLNELGRKCIRKTNTHSNVPNFDIHFMNAVSSDDSANFFDVFITGSASDVKILKDICESFLSKSCLSRRIFYDMMGPNSSKAKSSDGAAEDCEFNSKVYRGPRVFDVLLKLNFSSLNLAPFKNFSELMNQWYTYKADMIRAGGSIEQCQQITLSQMMVHYSVLGSNLNKSFPRYYSDLSLIKHHSLGFYEYERNPTLCGLVPFFYSHYQWISESPLTNITEKKLNSNVFQTIDKNNMPVLSINIEQGTTVIDMKKSLVCKELAKEICGEDPEKFVQDKSLTVLLGRGDHTLDIVRRLLQSSKLNKQRTNSSTRIYKSGIFLMGLPSITVGFSAQERMKQDILSRGKIKSRMSLMTLVSRVKDMMINASNSSLFDNLSKSTSEHLLKTISEISIVNTSKKKMNIADRAGSGTSEILSSEMLINPKNTTIYKIWTGSKLTTSEYQDVKNINDLYPWVGLTMEESFENSRGFFETTLEMIEFLRNSKSLIFKVQSRSGIQGFPSVAEALCRTVEHQYAKSRFCRISVGPVKCINTNQFTQLRDASKLDVMFHDVKTRDFLKCELRDLDTTDENILKSAASRDMTQSRILCLSLILKKTFNPDHIESHRKLFASATSSTWMFSEQDRNQISLYQGQHRVRFHLTGITVYSVSLSSNSKHCKDMVSRAWSKLSRTMTYSRSGMNVNIDLENGATGSSMGEKMVPVTFGLIPFSSDYNNVRGLRSFDGKLLLVLSKNDQEYSRLVCPIPNLRSNSFVKDTVSEKLLSSICKEMGISRLVVKSVLLEDEIKAVDLLNAAKEIRMMPLRLEFWKLMLKTVTFLTNRKDKSSQAPELVVNMDDFANMEPKFSTVATTQSPFDETFDDDIEIVEQYTDPREDETTVTQNSVWIRDLLFNNNNIVIDQDGNVGVANELDWVRYYLTKGEMVEIVENLTQETYEADKAFLESF